MKQLFILILSILLLSSCSVKTETETPIEKKLHLVYDISSFNEIGELNAVVEISSGTIEKWEVNKETGELDIETIDGEIRKIDYLPYPGNYGMVPQTILPKELGGDGDPLDILILGPSVEKGNTVNCKVIGVLKLLDRGEQDDKLIAVQKGTKMYRLNDISELDSLYKGISLNIETWFTNYKGSNKMQSQGFGNKQEADKILSAAMKAYSKIK